jgi:hypothetical protein
MLAREAAQGHNRRLRNSQKQHTKAAIEQAAASLPRCGDLVCVTNEDPGLMSYESSRAQFNHAECKGRPALQTPCLLVLVYTVMLKDVAFPLVVQTTTCTSRGHGAIRLTGCGLEFALRFVRPSHVYDGHYGSRNELDIMYRQEMFTELHLGCVEVELLRFR